jgi:hypothetical protein
LVPTITLFEVFKRVAAQRDENDAITCMAVMQQGEVAAIDAAFGGMPCAIFQSPYLICVWLN